MISSIEWMLADISPHDDIYIWGACESGKHMQNVLENLGYKISGYLDSNKNGIFNGYPIIKPTYILGLDATFIVVVADFYIEIWDFLKKNNIHFSYVGGRREETLTIGDFVDNKGNVISSESSNISVKYGLCSAINLGTKISAPNAEFESYAFSKITISDNVKIGSNTHIVSKNKSNITIGENVIIGNNCSICSVNNAEIYIGDNVIINDMAHIDIIDEGKLVIGKKSTFAENVDMRAQRSVIDIGDDCLFSYGIKVRGDNGHTMVDDALGSIIKKPRKTKIGNHVWCGMGATILAGTAIGDKSIVGAESLVCKCFGEGNLIVGSPATKRRENINWKRTADYIV